jgi:hypothetical protein
MLKTDRIKSTGWTCSCYFWKKWQEISHLAKCWRRIMFVTMFKILSRETAIKIGERKVSLQDQQGIRLKRKSKEWWALWVMIEILSSMRFKWRTLISWQHKISCWTILLGFLLLESNKGSSKRRLKKNRRSKRWKLQLKCLCRMIKKWLIK